MCIFINENREVLINAAYPFGRRIKFLGGHFFVVPADDLRGLVDIGRRASLFLLGTTVSALVVWLLYLSSQVGKEIVLLTSFVCMFAAAGLGALLFLKMSAFSYVPSRNQTIKFLRKESASLYMPLASIFVSVFFVSTIYLSLQHRPIISTISMFLSAMLLFVIVANFISASKNFKYFKCV